MHPTPTDWKLLISESLTGRHWLSAARNCLNSFQLAMKNWNSPIEMFQMLFFSKFPVFVMLRSFRLMLPTCQFHCFSLWVLPPLRWCSSPRATPWSLGWWWQLGHGSLPWLHQAEDMSGGKDRSSNRATWNQPQSSRSRAEVKQKNATSRQVLVWTSE